MTQRVLWLHLSMCKTCGVEREDALNICNICFHCINHAAWCCAAWCCAGCRAPPLNNSSSWWLGGSWPRLPTGTRHGLAAAARENSPHFGSLSHELQLLASAHFRTAAAKESVQTTNIRHNNELEDSFASVFWSHCHNKSGYTTWARDLCVANSK